ncbi:MAG: hypothetical protein A4E35_01324 [Methanoregula sp. PtaU1.Bin051]|nr:MAG: hypothetical protein A4E35_01324 [Methanoregula sp. PtaU1.Bin051]
MTGNDPHGEYGISKSRLEALVDGIFAFAMTLLVTGLVIPQLTKSEASAELPGKIAAMRPEFFAFFIAFFILASFWLVHHRNFHFVRAVNPMLVRINLFILAFIVMVPFTTNISGDYPDTQIAVCLFHLNLFIVGLLFLFHWWYMNKKTGTISEGIDRRDAVNGFRRGFVVPMVSALAIFISFASPPYSMATYLLLIPSFWMVQRFSRD